MRISNRPVYNTCRPLIKEMHMRYLVTGATAFAGSHLVKLLINEGHEVWATSRRTNGSETDILDLLSSEEFNSINWIFCNLLNKKSCFDAFKTADFDGVFHLAAQSHPPTGFQLPFYTQEVNVIGTLYLLEAVTELQPNTFFLFCSTSEVYGAPELREGEKITENYPIKPINPYASSKAMIDIFLQERLKNNYLNGCITRAFSHTGPRRGRIFSISSDAFQIAKIILKQQEPIIKVGNLKSKRPVMDVRDCVRAYYLLMSKRATGIYNIGADNCYEIGHFLNIMLEQNNLSNVVKTKVYEKYWRPIDIHIQIPDVLKLKNEINWRCEIPIQQTLKDLVQYWIKRLK